MLYPKGYSDALSTDEKEKKIFTEQHVSDINAPACEQQNKTNSLATLLYLSDVACLYSQGVVGKN